MTGLPASLVENPRLDQWLRVRPDNGVTLLVGKVELGQGILTALAQIAAEELELPVEMVEVISGHTDLTPNEGSTAGSLSIQVGGAAVRLACADAMLRLTEAARKRLAIEHVVPLGDGRLAADGTGESGSLGYSELGEEVDWCEHVSASAPPKSAPYRLVGTPVPRLDLERTITGGGFVHDLELPGLLHGRVLRPPALRAELEAFDAGRVEACPGVIRVVHDGRFVGVVAEREEQALRALDVARDACRWRVEETIGGSLSAKELVSSSPSSVLRGERLVGQEPAAAGNLTRRATFSRPFIAHASIGPSCAVARLEPAGAKRRLAVWSHTQNVFALRMELARTLGLGEDVVTVHHLPGSGCYGHNGADDAALDASLLARALPGRPVRVQWSREDELAWSPVGSAMVVEIEAALDARGSVTSWQLDTWSGTHASRPGIGDGFNLLAARHLSGRRSPSPPYDPPPLAGGGGDRNAVALYEFPRQETRYHFVAQMPLRTSSLRSLGAFANVFAIESFMDELAERADADPVEFRLRHLRVERAATVIREAAQLASWPAQRRGADDDSGIGIGFARYKNNAAYCAVVAEVEAADEIRLRRVWCAVDAGLVINPDGLANQIEGAIVQAASWTLKEQVQFDRKRITSATWKDYPILRFSEVPEIEVRIVDQSAKPSLGVGEAAHGPTAAAIGNAVAAALGIRVRDMPLTRDAVVAAIDG